MSFIIIIVFIIYIKISIFLDLVFIIIIERKLFHQSVGEVGEVT